MSENNGSSINGVEPADARNQPAEEVDALPLRKSTKAPAFQFYPKDFLNDEAQALMSLDAAGAYIRLLCACWLNGSIPADTAAMAKLVGATAKHMSRIWPSIEPTFRQRADGRWVHPRLDRERQKQKDYREAQAAKAASRWERLGNATASSRQCRNDGLQSPISNLHTTVEERTPEADASFDAFWSEYPRKVGKGAAFAVWRKLKPSAQMVDLMLGAVRRQRLSMQWRRDGGQFVPHPTTWLKQRRWEDEPDLVATGTEGRGVTGAAPVGKYDALEEC